MSRTESLKSTSSIAATFIAAPPPLYDDRDGVVRVAATRVTLDVVVGEYWNGLSPEEIASAYDSLAPGDVYAVLAYYLNNRNAVDEYLQERRNEADKVVAEIKARMPKNLRERLLARHARQLAGNTQGETAMGV